MSNIEKLFATLAAEQSFLQVVIEDTLHSHHVSTAVGVSLDYLGSLVACVRDAGETDKAFRGRVKGQIANYVGGGTKESIQIHVAGYVGVDVEDVEVYDGYTEAYGWGSYLTLLKMESNLTDYFGNHNGTGTPTYVDARHEKGIRFKQPAGVAAAYLANHADFNTPDFSVAFFVKVPTTSADHYFAGKGPETFIGSEEWWVKFTSAGKIEVFIDCLTTDVSFDTGTDTWSPGDELFVALTWDDSENEARLYVAEVGDLYLHKYTDTSSSGVRQTGTDVVYIAESSNSATGWLDEFLYEKDAIISNFDIHMLYASILGIDTYGHFGVAIWDWDADSKIQPGDMAAVIAIVDDVKAAGVKCDYVGPAIEDVVLTAEATSYSLEDAVYEDTVTTVDDGNRYHYAGITYTDSLNIVG